MGVPLRVGLSVPIFLLASKGFPLQSLTQGKRKKWEKLYEPRARSTTARITHAKKASPFLSWLFSLRANNA